LYIENEILAFLLFKKIARNYSLQESVKLTVILDNEIEDVFPK